jgi:hypothetical protein
VVARHAGDGAGAFAINGVPIGEQAIEAANAIGTALVKVNIDAARADTCRMVL